VSFSLSGKQLSADHGYLVYSAISRASESLWAASAPGSSPTVREGVNTGTAGVSPARSPLHKADWLAIELISGFPSGLGLIVLPEHDATLRLRIPATHYRDVLPLAGKRLDIGGHRIRLGLPIARPLEPAPSLYARVVTIKNFTEPEPFLEAVKRKLDSFGIKGRVELPRDEQGRNRRRIVTIHGKSVVGFSVAARLIMSSVQRLSAIIEFRISYLPKQHSHCSTPYTA
jgi:CRISPR-associated protein Cas6